MHCEGCRKKVQRALTGMPGIEELLVDRAEQKVTVKGNIDSKKLLAKLLRTGKITEQLQVPDPGKLKEAAKEAPAPKDLVKEASFPPALLTEPIMEGQDFQLETPLVEEDNLYQCSIM